ncbi:hypothetical protein [Eudoraea adriatica]|uniref:hypothetical protein n=1 Tax=Eudoraea adriatica TaxID=446681 RepID=UPI00036332A4|nr:hypothetical protein [Eudoraea adriatica]
MPGLHQQLGSESQNKATIPIVNTTAFVEISKSFTLGLEFNNSDPGNFDEEEPELPAMPQVLIECSDH